MTTSTVNQSSNNLELLKAKADEAFKQKQWPQALDAWQLLLDTFPAHYPAHVGQAKTLVELDRYTEAEAIFTRLAQDYPKHVQGFHGLAQLAIRTQQWNLALERCGTLIQKFPNHFQGYAWQGKALVELGRFDEAEAVFNYLTEYYPKRLQGFHGLAQCAFRNQQWSVLLNRCQKLLEKFPKHLQSEIWRGDAFCRLGYLNEAVEAYQKALNLKPSHSLLYQKLSEAQIQIGNLRAAQQTLESSISKNPSDAQSYTGYARFQKEWLKDFAGAYSTLQEAKRANSDFLPALVEEANLFLQLGRHQKAVESFTNILNHFPDKPHGYTGLSRVAWYQEDYEQSAIIWGKVVNLFPEQRLSASYEKARCLMKLARIDEAESIYLNLCDQFSSSPLGHCGIAEVSENRLQWSHALETWAYINQNFPDYDYAFYRHSELLFKLGQPDVAHSLLQNICESSPKAYLWLSRLCFRNNRVQEALKNANVAMSAGFLSGSFAQILLCSLRLGDLEGIERLSEKFWTNEIYLCSTQTYDELVSALGLLSDAAFEEAWDAFIKLFSFGSELTSLRISQGLKPSSATFIFFLVAFAQTSLEHKQKDWFDCVVDHVETNQEFFECQPYLLSVLHLLAGQYFQKSQEMFQALAEAQTGLALSPDNEPCLELIETILKSQSDLSKNFSRQQDQESVALMIVSCRKNNEKVKVLRDKLYSQIKLPYIFIIGKPELVSNWKRKGDILYVKVPDNYESLPLKVLKAFEYFHCCTNYKGILKIDDDCWISKPSHLKTILHRFADDCSVDYLGKINDIALIRSWHFRKCDSEIKSVTPYSKPINTQYCAGGWGYYLSRRALRVLFEVSYKYPDILEGEIYGLEDVLIGKILTQEGIKPLPFNFTELGLIDFNCNPLLHSVNQDSLHEKIEELISQGAYTSAINYFYQLLQLEPDQAYEIYQELFQLLLVAERPAQAKVLANVIHSRFPDEPSGSTRLEFSDSSLRPSEENPDKNLKATQKLAQEAMAQERWQLALESWDKILGDFPNHFPAYKGKGNALVKLSRFEEAEAWFTQLIERYPDRVQGLHGLAQVAIRTQQWSLALERCETVLQQFPEHLQGYAWKGQALLHLSRFEEAEAWFTQLIERYPDRVQGLHGLAQVAIRTQQWSLALERCDKVIEKFPEDFVGYSAKVSVLIQTEDFDAASDLLEQVLPQHPDEPALLRSLIHVASNTQRWDFAIEKVKSFAQHNLCFLHNPTDDSPFFKVLDWLFNQLLSSYKYPEAEVVINFLVEKGTPDALIKVWQSYILFDQGKYALAEKSCLASLSQCQEMADLVYSLLMKFSWQRHDLEQVLSWQNKIFPSDSGFYIGSAIQAYHVYIRQGEIEQAKLILRQLIDLCPTKDKGYIFLAETLCFHDKNFEGTLKVCNQAIQKGLSDEKLYCYKALALSKLGAAREACHVVDQYLQQAPLSRLALMARATAYRYNENYEESLASLNQWLEEGNFTSIISTGQQHQLNIQYLKCEPGYEVDADAKISVIMTTYRREELLPIAISSVLNQTYRNLELIIVDDCSPDDNYEYLKTVATTDSRIRLLQLDQNSGTYVAKNHAMTFAQGDYISFIDSDDWIHPQTLERQIEILQNEDILGVICGFFRVDEASHIEFKPEAPDIQAHITFCFKKNKVIDKIGYFDAVRTAADHEYLQRFLAVFGPHRLKRLKFPLLVSTRHSNSITGGGPLKLQWYGVGLECSLYAASFRKWHRQMKIQNQSLYMPHPLQQRRFDAPAVMMP